MPDVIAEVELDRGEPPREAERVTEIRASVMSPAGTLILAVTIVMSLVLVFSLSMPRLDGVQTFILVALTLASWAYALGCFTERLRLEGGVMEYRAWLSRAHTFELQEVRVFKLTDLGPHLSGVQYQFEVTTVEERKPVLIGLGPCWQRSDLVRFARSVSRELEDMPNGDE